MTKHKLLTKSEQDYEKRIAELEADRRRLEWCFGSTEDGASRQDIEEILMHTSMLDEARAMIDKQQALRREAESREGRS